MDESGSAAGAEAAPASRLTAIREAGRLRVCTTGDFPPFAVEDETGELAGIDVDMARDLALTLGVEVEWVKTEWKSLMEDFQAKCDIAVGGIDRTPERAEKAFFTTHTMVDGKTPLVRCEDVEEYQTVQDINRPGVTSIFPEGGTLEDYARDTFPRGELKSHDGPGSIFDEVIEGRADVITMDRSEVLYVDHDNEELCAANPDDPFTYAQKGYLLPQGDVVLKYYVDQWLSIARNDGTYEMISRPWFGDGDLMPGR
ncbi:transporter substrate-binding domain-containing protein [Citricoccus sp. SGAir0253]|uniref:transporter substrate-binding domain-containing protein n=1 Tax=Citricoccus sp. SGAir0253 TaxID=2567881 RepID=UPI001FEFB7F4|nr:transporter substrate-binding domain-containing protein [Citricoccus sp. SGAir0253]